MPVVIKRKSDRDGKGIIDQIYTVRPRTLRISTAIPDRLMGLANRCKPVLVYLDVPSNAHLPPGRREAMTAESARKLANVNAVLLDVKVGGINLLLDPSPVIGIRRCRMNRGGDWQAAAVRMVGWTKGPFPVLRVHQDSRPLPFKSDRHRALALPRTRPLVQFSHIYIPTAYMLVIRLSCHLPPTPVTELKRSLSRSLRIHQHVNHLLSIPARNTRIQAIPGIRRMKGQLPSWKSLATSRSMSRRMLLQRTRSGKIETFPVVRKLSFPKSLECLVLLQLRLDLPPQAEAIGMLLRQTISLP